MSILPLIDRCINEKGINKILISSITLSSGKILEKKFKDEKRIKNPLMKYLDVISREIKNKAQENSPVESGFLQNNWEAKVQTHTNPMAAVISSGVIYATRLEFSGYKPRRSGVIPFFRPAIQTVLNKIGNRGKELGKNVEKEMKRKWV